MDLTVGQLKARLKQFSQDAKITFGSSTQNLRPLIYYRCKWRGTYLHIELNELDSELHPQEPEYLSRITVKTLLEYIGSNLPDDTPVSFGFGHDSPLYEFQSVTPVVSFDLIQRECVQTDE